MPNGAVLEVSIKLSDPHKRIRGDDADESTTEEVQPGIGNSRDV